MVRLASALAAIVLFLGGAGLSARQTSAPDIVADVQAALASGGLARGELTLNQYRAARGMTPEGLEALCWLARRALADKLYDKADQYADEARAAAAAALRDDNGANNPRLLTTIGSAAEISALSLVEQGARSDAVYELRKALDVYRATPIAGQLESAIARVTLEGRPAPALEPGVSVGTHLPRAGETVQLLFFWAHWCQDCKSESATLTKIADKYQSRGLTIVAPTRRYGYVETGRPAPPDRELRHILQVRDSQYAFMRKIAVPVADANYKAFGVAAVPMHVLVDRHGIVRLYQQGVMTEAELDAAIDRVLER